MRAKLLHATHAVVVSIALLGTGCAVTPSGGGGAPTGRASSSGPALERVSPQDATRLRRIIEPLARASDHPPKQVTLGIIADRSINAANAGNGEFYVTRGLLDRANDDQLRAIMAHEFAHNDLGHVARAQRLQTGIDVGSAILESVIPRAAIITPIAGTLITRKYSRSEELAADKHAVTLLRRVGSSKESLQDALAWVARTSGGGEDGGGWFSTHPGTNERIEALRQLP
jgi:metalloprotease